MLGKFIHTKPSSHFGAFQINALRAKNRNLNPTQSPTSSPSMAKRKMMRFLVLEIH
jgi:hypothetical protein